MTTQETIAEIIDRHRPNYALVTFSAAVYQPWKTDHAITRKTNDDHGTKKALAVKKLTVYDARIERIQQLVGRARQLHYSMTRSWSGRRIGIIKAENLMDYSAKMRDYIHQFQAAVSEAAEEWPTIVAEQAGRLNGTFRIEDYPTQEEFKNRFDLRVYVDELPASGDHQLAVSPEVIEALAGTFEEQTKQRVEAMYQDLLAAAEKQVRDASRILSQDDPQRIRDAMVKNLKDQVQWLRDLNLTNDDRLTGLANSIERHLCKDPNLLRDDAGERRKAADGASKILKGLRNNN